MTAIRKIPTVTVHNLRDLGGFPTLDGSRVKQGLVYRSDDLSELSDEDRALVDALGIRTVVDFRTRQESNYLPDQVPDSVVNTQAIPIDAGKLVGNIYGGTLNRRKVMGIMVSVYRQLVADFIPSFRHFFQLLADRENLPLLFHCTAGKDRTGVAAALFLSALGVEQRLIIEDYVYSAECLKSKYVEGRDFDDIMEPVYTVYPEFIQAAFDTIDARFGGVDTYLKEQLEVDDAALRRMYTEG